MPRGQGSKDTTKRCSTNRKRLREESPFLRKGVGRILPRPTARAGRVAARWAFPRCSPQGLANASVVQRWDALAGAVTVRAARARTWPWPRTSRSHAPLVVPQGEWSRECLQRAVVGQLIAVFTQSPPQGQPSRRGGRRARRISSHHHEGAGGDPTTPRRLVRLDRRGPPRTPATVANPQGVGRVRVGKRCLRGQGATSRWSTKTAAPWTASIRCLLNLPARGRRRRFTVLPGVTLRAAVETTRA